MYRTELITFCGSKVNVVFDVNGVDGKNCFNDFENGKYKFIDKIVTRHPNIVRGVITSKKGWGLWVKEWGDGIGDGLFSKNEILNEFKMKNIELPESFLKELDDSIKRKLKRKIMDIKVINTEWDYIVFIESDVYGKFFGFMRERPAISAQGDSINEVKEKIDKIFEIDKKRNGAIV